MFVVLTVCLVLGHLSRPAGGGSCVFRGEAAAATPRRSGAIGGLPIRPNRQARRPAATTEGLRLYGLRGQKKTGGPEAAGQG